MIDHSLSWTPQFFVIITQPYIIRHLVPFSTVVAHRRDCGFLLYTYFELIERWNVGAKRRKLWHTQLTSILNLCCSCCSLAVVFTFHISQIIWILTCWLIQNSVYKWTSPTCRFCSHRNVEGTSSEIEFNTVCRKHWIVKLALSADTLCRHALFMVYFTMLEVASTDCRSTPLNDRMINEC